MTNVRWVAPALVLAALMTLGCGNKNLGRVSGTVTMDGQPLPNAMVVFTPVQGGRPGAAKTDAQGKYELVYSRDSMGAMVGDHYVSITTYDEAVKDDESVEIVPETVPSRYNSNSELTATIKSGGNVVDFALESGGEVIQPEE